MFMRLLQLKVKNGEEERLPDFYEKTVVSQLQQVDGCQFANLIQNRQRPEEFISMTLWDTQEHAEAYEKSELFQKLWAEISPQLADTSEWKIQLSPDMELTYAPVSHQPEIHSFVVAVQASLKPDTPPQACQMYVRIFSIKLQPGKVAEFKRIYTGEILPELQRIRGCCYAYLMENVRDPQQFMSATIWENPQDADEYERSGRFRELVDRVKHTFAQLFQWKIDLGKMHESHVKTSEDGAVNLYTLVSGKRFDES